MTKRKSRSEIPEGVKRPLNPFQCFIKAMSKVYRNEGQGEKKTSKEFGIMWRTEMAEEDKEEYYQMAKLDRTRYESELTAAGCKVKKRKSDSEHPSRPCPPFLFYTSKNCKDVMEEKIVNYHEALKILGERWKTMDENAKKPYMEMAKNDREKWLDEYRARAEVVAEQVYSI